ncbi:UNVERIFIED_CONTAM: hypothetical protein FKN15_074202 [Acipenser sinensis]
MSDVVCFFVHSVEHDFRLQEGQFQRTWRVVDPESSQSSPLTSSTASRQEDSPVPKHTPATKMESKKSKRKCFWFM